MSMKRKNAPKQNDKTKKPKKNGKAPVQPSKQERMSKRKHADVVKEAKVIWNQLRLKTNTTEMNRDLMDKLFPLIKDKAHDIALQHDASRIVQAAIKFGNVEERRIILKELCTESANLAELAKSQYSHFCVLKAIKYCHTDEESVKLIVKALKGHMAKLAVHAVGSRTVEMLFSTLPPKRTAVLKQEFYGPHFALFVNDIGDSVPTLISNLDKAPEKKEQALDFVQNLVNKGIEKSLYGFNYFQDLLDEYCAVAGSSEIRTIAGTAADNVIHLLSSRAGTRVAAAIIAYGTAKDRKRIMKSLKGYTKSGLLHHDAYLAIIRLVQLTDDTVSIQKNVLNELLTAPDNADELPLLEVALSDTGSKLLLMLLIANDEARRKCFDPYELSILFTNPTVIEDGQEVSTSKKDDNTRREELIKHLREPLNEMCSKHAEVLLRSRPGSIVLREVYASFPSKKIANSVIDVCSSSLKGEDKDRLPIFEDPVGHLAIKNLFLLDATTKTNGDLALVFVESLKDSLMDVATSNRGAFVLAALLKVNPVREQVILSLDQNKIQKWSKGGGATAGFAALLKEIEGERS